MVKCCLPEILLAVAVRQPLNAVEVVCSLSLMELAQPCNDLDMTVAILRYRQGLGNTHYASCALLYRFTIDEGYGDHLMRSAVRPDVLHPC